MDRIKIVNATGLACPQPVVLAKQAIETGEQVKVIVDNETALENVKRLGTKLGCEVKSESKEGGLFEIMLTRKAGVPLSTENVNVSCDTSAAVSGPFVIVCSEDKMGRGNDELGSVLIRAFFHTVAEQTERPDIIIFYNTGVRLTVQGSDVLEDLKALSDKGAEILVCGTCLNFFNIKEMLGVGIVSNMYDISGTLSRAGRIVNP
jgi:selenium metabolism protein YedF